MINLTENDILEIYHKFVSSKNNETYLNRYNTLPPNPNKNWDWYGKDFPRVIAVLEFKKFINENNLKFEKILTLNGDTDPEYKHLVYEKK